MADEVSKCSLSELLVVASLSCVIKKSLPRLTREVDSGYYYVQGNIGASDKEFLYNFTKRIGELTLGKEPDSESRLASHVFVRIALFHDANKPLFPSLHRLRILNTSSSLDFLHLLLSPALATLELIAIPVDNPHYSSVISFLECAIDEAPDLSTLILGPGVATNRVLDISLKYRNLRRLELLEVGIAFTGQMLLDMGSLQHLETFVFRDNGASTYTRSPLMAEAIVDSSLFPALRTLQLEAPLNFTGVLVEKVRRMLSNGVTNDLKRRRSKQKWPNSLVSVSFKNTHTRSLSLPSDIFKKLLLRPDLERLEITGMGICSMESTLHRLQEVGNSKLEDLHLPIHRTAPDIPLAQLRDIAKACPHLQSFRCRFRNLSDVKASDPLSHQLKKLSLSNSDIGILDKQALLGIAHYLDSTFPNLESIETDDIKNGDWRFISDLVKLCQAVWKDDENRRLKGKCRSKVTVL